MFVHAYKKQSIKWLIKWQVPRQICHETLVFLVEYSGVPFTHYSRLVGFSRLINGQIAAASSCLPSINMLLYNVKRAHLLSSRPQHFISFVSLFLLNGSGMAEALMPCCYFFSTIQVCHQLLEICTLIGDLDTSILVNTWKALKRWVIASL